jgi:hypothetical protein
MNDSTLASGMPPDWSDCSLLVVPEQAPICVYLDESGAVVINQQKWRESDDEVFIIVRPEHVRTLCRAIFKEAGIDPDVDAREVSVKDATANERQRRRRERLRDGHDQNSVTVTGQIANDVDGPHQESASANQAE